MVQKRRSGKRRTWTDLLDEIWSKVFQLKIIKHLNLIQYWEYNGESRYKIDLIFIQWFCPIISRGQIRSKLSNHSEFLFLFARKPWPGWYQKRMENPLFLRSSVREKLTLENIKSAKHVNFQFPRERESTLLKICDVITMFLKMFRFWSLKLILN